MASSPNATPIPNPFFNNNNNNNNAFIDNIKSAMDVAMHIILSIRQTKINIANIQTSSSTTTNATNNNSNSNAISKIKRNIENLLRANVTSAIHCLLIKRYSEFHNNNDNNNNDNNNNSTIYENNNTLSLSFKHALQNDMYQLLVAIFNALELNQINKEDYTDCILYIFQTCKFQNRNMYNGGGKGIKIPKQQMVQIQRMLHALKMVFISLLNDGNNGNNKKDTETNETKTINTLNKLNTTKLNFISICQNVPHIERQLRFEILQNWPYPHTIINDTTTKTTNNNNNNNNKNDKLGQATIFSKKEQERFRQFKIVATNHNRDSYHILSNLSLDIKYTNDMIKYWNIMFNECVIRKGMLDIVEKSINVTDVVTTTTNINQLVNIYKLKLLAIYLMIDAAIFKIVDDVDKVRFIMKLVGIELITPLINDNYYKRTIEGTVQLIYNKDNVYDDDKNNPTHKENCNKLFHLSILFPKPSKHGKRMIRNNSRTLLSNAKRMLQKWMNEEKENPNNNNNQNVRISIPLFNTLYNAVQKCLELQILYDFIKKKNWHAADEYCSHTMTNNNNNNNEEEQQLSPSPSSTNHLITILNMVKKEYSYLQMQNKHHVYKNKSNITTISVSSTATTTSSMQHERLQPELINILKDVTIEEKKMKKLHNKQHSLELELTMKNGKILIVETIDTIIKMKTMLLTEAKMLLNNHKPLPSSTTFFSSLKNKLVIGFDLEWRDPELVSIIQLSTATQAYVIDISVKEFSKEEKQIYYVELYNILNAIFMNTLVTADGTPIDIALCCFGLKNDYERLKEVLVVAEVDNDVINKSKSMMMVDNKNVNITKNKTNGRSNILLSKSLPKLDDLNHIYDFSLPPLIVDMLLKDENYIQTISNSIILLCNNSNNNNNNNNDDDKNDAMHTKKQNELIQTKVSKLVTMLFSNSRMTEQMYMKKFPYIADNGKFLPSMIKQLLPKLATEYVKNMELYSIQQLHNNCYNRILNEEKKKKQRQHDDNNNNNNNKSKRYRHKRKTKKQNRIRKPFWNISLSKLVEHCFGKSLDKTEQCSNWERRPLNISQIEYGAMDAYILVKIFHHVVDLTKQS